jgi:hypothetical protein
MRCETVRNLLIANDYCGRLEKNSVNCADFESAFVLGYPMDRARFELAPASERYYEGKTPSKLTAVLRYTTGPKHWRNYSTSTQWLRKT